MPAEQGSGAPQQIGPYRLLEELGRGAFGVVYRARRAGLERDFALKVLLNATPEDVARFKREAQIAAMLVDPGIVGALDLGRHGHHFYYVMEYCPGSDLRARHRHALRIRGGRQWPGSQADVVLEHGPASRRLGDVRTTVCCSIAPLRHHGLGGGTTTP